jgi:peptidoglycan hydrolase CwlO-like protein
MAFALRHAMPMTLVRRIEILERDVNALRHLPEKVSAVAADLAALRGDVTQLQSDVTQLRGDVTQFRSNVTQFQGDVRAEFAAVRDEIRTGDEETRRQMRILHEEVISRIALLDEGRKTRRHRKR